MGTWARGTVGNCCCCSTMGDDDRDCAAVAWKGEQPTEPVLWLLCEGIKELRELRKGETNCADPEALVVV